MFQHYAVLLCHAFIVLVTFYTDLWFALCISFASHEWAVLLYASFIHPLQSWTNTEQIEAEIMECTGRRQLHTPTHVFPTSVSRTLMPDNVSWWYCIGCFFSDFCVASNSPIPITKVAVISRGIERLQVFKMYMKTYFDLISKRNSPFMLTHTRARYNCDSHCTLVIALFS